MVNHCATRLPGWGVGTQPLQFTFIAPAEELPGLAFGFAVEDEVDVAIAAEDVAAFEVDRQVKRADDAGLSVFFEQGLRNDLVPLQLDQAGILEKPPGRFDLLREAPLPLHLHVEVEVGKRKRGVEQLFVQGDIP